MFPQRSGLRQDILLLRNPAQDYPAIRLAALALVSSGHITDLLRSTYGRLIVDEYQDCSSAQHALIAQVAAAIPTVVLGDPMQAIFGFGRDPLADWDADVCSTFPEVATLDTPWRWLNAGEEELGRWLLDARECLLGGGGIDLRGAPASVTWVELTGSADYTRQLRAARTPAPNRHGTVLILADSRKPSEQRRFASRIPGAATVEAVDLRDFVAFADRFDFSSRQALQRAVDFAESIMTNLDGTGLLSRVDILERGNARKRATEAETSALRFKHNPSVQSLADLLQALNEQGGVRVYRPTVLRACYLALRRCAENTALAFGEAARRVREEHRAGSRAIAARAVGSTLLLKGLEADMAIVLDASSMDAHHLYVAITRGARRLVVCAHCAQLSP
jgi:DNA helicase-2/ATP-dependent DNA helicase PcrA